MSQAPSSAAWCAALQAKMMAALDAAWAMIETSDDPAVLAKARDRARICAQMASAVRKVAALVPPAKGPAKPANVIDDALDEVEKAATALGKSPAAQAVAMQAALRKLKRR